MFQRHKKILGKGDYHGHKGLGTEKSVEIGNLTSQGTKLSQVM